MEQHEYLDCVSVLSYLLQFDAVQVHVRAELRAVLLQRLYLLLRGEQLVLETPLLLLGVLQMVIDLLTGDLQMVL